MPDNDADAVLDRDQSDRMARMAQRLAAAGPRTRQRVLERHGDLRGASSDPGGGWWPRVDAGDRAAPDGARDPLAATPDGAAVVDAISLRHFAWLGVAAALGFGAVAVGQSPRLAALLRDAGRRADAGQAAVAESAPAVSSAAQAPAGQEPAQTAQTTPLPAAPQVVARAVTTSAKVPDAPPADLPTPGQAATVDEAAGATSAPTVDAPGPHRAMAKIVRPSLLAKAPRLQRAAFVTVPHHETIVRRPAAHAAARRLPRPLRPPAPHQAVRYQLPHWLTDQAAPRPAPPREIIMSPPPQMLSVPQYYPGSSQ